MYAEVFKGGGKHPWYMRLKSYNGKTIVVSEGYSSKSAATAAAKKAFPTLDIRVDDGDDA